MFLRSINQSIPSMKMKIKFGWRFKCARLTLGQSAGINWNLLQCLLCCKLISSVSTSSRRGRRSIWRKCNISRHRNHLRTGIKSQKGSHWLGCTYQRIYYCWPGFRKKELACQIYYRFKKPRWFPERRDRIPGYNWAYWRIWFWKKPDMPYIMRYCCSGNSRSN